MWQTMFHVHTKQQAALHTCTFASVPQSTVHLFQAVSHSVSPTRATCRPVLSDGISSPHVNNVTYLFLESQQYVISHSLIFTVMTSRVTCGQPRFPCLSGFLPEAACSWRNSPDISLIHIKYFGRYIMGPTVLEITRYINAILSTVSKKKFKTVFKGIQFFWDKMCRLVNYRLFIATFFLHFRGHPSSECPLFLDCSDTEYESSKFLRNVDIRLHRPGVRNTGC
jgi:hypothetical protein